MTHSHGGNLSKMAQEAGKREEEILDFSANINQLGPPGWLGDASFRTLSRDARNHSSPNAGFPEAAMAGALGVQLGGLNHYLGEPVSKPTIGTPIEGLAKEHIPRANTLMLAASGLFLAACLGMRSAILLLLETWRAAP